MQATTQNEDYGKSAGSETALGRCLVDGDPATTSLARRARRKAFGASLALETSLLALLLIVPLLTGAAQPLLHKIPPPQLTFVRAWRAPGPVQQVVSPATARPSAIFNPIAPLHPASVVDVRPTYDGPPLLAGPDGAAPDVPGDGRGMMIAGPALVVEPPHVAPPPQQEKRPLKVSEGLLAAQLITRVEPRYPVLGLQMHLQGTVHLHALISRDGRITSLEVVSGHPLLVQAALDAVRQWRYRPTMLDGEPVEVETTISVEFRLQN